MLQSFVVPPLITDGPLWSLAVEWWLYVVAPWLRKRTVILLVFLVFSLSYDFFQSPVDVSHLEYGRTLFCVAWYWLLGFLYYRHRRTSLGYAVLFLPILLAHKKGIFMGHAIILGLMALVVADFCIFNHRWRRVFDRLGDLSYPMYLIHIPIIIMAKIIGLTQPTILYIIVLGLSWVFLDHYEAPVKLWLKECFRRLECRD